MSKRKGKPIVRRRTVPQDLTDHSINLSLTDALEYVISFKQSEGCRQRTIDGYRNAFKYFFEYLDEQQPDVSNIQDVTGILVRDFVNYSVYEKVNNRNGEVGLSPVTVNIRLRVLKSFFSVLQKEEIIEKNPVKGVRQLRVDEDTFTPLNELEIDRLLKQPDIKEYAPFRDLVAMYLTLDTGIRAGELFSLERRHVDFKSRSIVLTADISKSRKPRVLPLSNQVLKLVMELVNEVAANFDTEFIFVSNFGEEYSPTSFRRRLDIYKKQARIEKRVTPHLLRHQFCRDYIMNGGDIFTLQRIAGHEDISTTRKYIQFTTDDLQKQHAQFSPIARRRKKYRNK